MHIYPRPTSGIHIWADNQEEHHLPVATSRIPHPVTFKRLYLQGDTQASTGQASEQGQASSDWCRKTSPISRMTKKWLEGALFHLCQRLSSRRQPSSRRHKIWRIGETEATETLQWNKKEEGGKVWRVTRQLRKRLPQRDIGALRRPLSRKQ